MADENIQPENQQEKKQEPVIKEKPVRTSARAQQRPRSKRPVRRDFVPREPQKARPVVLKREKKIPPLKLFGRWDSIAEITDPGLKNYINLEPRFLPRSAGVHRNQFHKSKMHIVERLALHLFIPGHQGKKHRLTSGKLAGNFDNV